MQKICLIVDKQVHQREHEKLLIACVNQPTASRKRRRTLSYTSHAYTHSLDVHPQRRTKTISSGMHLLGQYSQKM
jgi:hypothetical protein